MYKRLILLLTLLNPLSITLYAAKMEEEDSSSESYQEPIKGKDNLLVTFSNFQDSKIKKFSDKAPKWRKLVQGMNLEAICSNSKCKAYKRKVWVPCGFGSFYMAETISEAVCPICHKKGDLSKRKR